MTHGSNVMQGAKFQCSGRRRVRHPLGCRRAASFRNLTLLRDAGVKGGAFPALLPWIYPSLLVTRFIRLSSTFDSGESVESFTEGHFVLNTWLSTGLSRRTEGYFTAESLNRMI